MKKTRETLAVWLLLSGSVLGLEVFNAGAGGNNTRQGLARMDRDVVSRHPDVCLIAFGMNDAVNSRNSVPLDTFQENLRQIVRRCRDAQIRPVFITVNPVNEAQLYRRHKVAFYEEHGGANKRIQAYNRAIQTVAGEAGADVIAWHRKVMAVSGTSVEPGSILRHDGVHLSTKGLATLAELVAAWVERNNQQDSVVVAFGDSITKQGWIDTVRTRIDGAGDAGR